MQNAQNAHSPFTLANLCLGAGIWTSIWITIFAGDCQASNKSFFQSSSAGYTVNWSEKDLAATQATPGAILFSAGRIARAERPKKSAKTTVDRSFKLLSLVGPYLSYQDESTLDWPGMVHPGVGDVRLYHAVDLRHPDKKALLTDVFAPQDVYAALMANPLVQKSLKQSHEKPKDMTALLKALKDTDVATTNADGNEAKLLFNRDMLSQFCFNKVTPKGADLSLSLYDQANNEIYPMRLTLPQKNSELGKWLTDADAKKAGVLADKIAKAMPDASTDFHFDP